MLKGGEIMSAEIQKEIAYIVACVSAFAIRRDIHPNEAFLYLHQHGGIAFLTEHYEIEHTLPFEDAIDDLELVCLQEGISA